MQNVIFQLEFRPPLLMSCICLLESALNHVRAIMPLAADFFQGYKTPIASSGMRFKKRAYTIGDKFCEAAARSPCAVFIKPIALYPHHQALEQPLKPVLQQLVFRFQGKKYTTTYGDCFPCKCAIPHKGHLYLRAGNATSSHFEFELRGCVSS